MKLTSSLHTWQVLSDLLADLDACDIQKGDAKLLANGEIAPGKFSSDTQTHQLPLKCLC